MEFIITEKQLQLIIKEEKNNDELSDDVKTMYSFTYNMVHRVMKTFNLNLKMLLTWGSGVGGLMMPLSEFIESGNFNITEDEKYLVLASVAFLIFFEGKRGTTKLLEKIKENGLGDVFNQTYEKGLQLKESFANFLRSVKNISGQFFEIMAYAFLIPIFPDILDVANNVTDVSEAATIIAERLLASGLIALSKEVLTNTLRNIIKKIR